MRVTRPLVSCMDLDGVYGLSRFSTPDEKSAATEAIRIEFVLLPSWSADMNAIYRSTVVSLA